MSGGASWRDRWSSLLAALLIVAGVTAATLRDQAGPSFTTPAELVRELVAAGRAGDVERYRRLWADTSAPPANALPESALREEYSGVRGLSVLGEEALDGERVLVSAQLVGAAGVTDLRIEALRERSGWRVLGVRRAP